MNINCVICSDLLTPTAEVFVTKCGHMFHYTCLVNWLGRKKTCPHCRNTVTEKTILKVYFNIADINEKEQDVGTLVNKIDNLQFQHTLNQKDLKTYKSKVKSLNEVTVALRTEISELENKIRTYESAMYALKDQITFFKSQSKEADKLRSEILRLKQLLNDLQNVQLAVEGTREQVNDMIRNENNAESLALLAATLKKTLLDVERKKRELEIKNKRQLNETSKLKKELSEVKCQNIDLQKELHHLKSNYDQEKKFLKNKIIDIGKKVVTLNESNNSLDCIILESPINFNRTPKVKPESISGNDDSKSSSNITPKQKLNISTTISSEDGNDANDSLYLMLKSNAPTMNFKTRIVNNTGKEGYSIFKSNHLKTDDVKKATALNSEYYNGLGGSSKEDVFPSPKPAKVTLKRHKSSSAVSSNKLRKLAPLSSSAVKINDFLSQT